MVNTLKKEVAIKIEKLKKDIQDLQKRRNEYTQQIDNAIDTLKCEIRDVLKNEVRDTYFKYINSDDYYISYFHCTSTSYDEHYIYGFFIEICKSNKDLDDFDSIHIDKSKIMYLEPGNKIPEDYEEVEKSEFDEFVETTKKLIAQF